MRPGGPAEHSRLIRPLVLAWIGQNILLVISSIFRLDLYVAAYSLTYLRIAAFIWMMLVATGLLLILIQIVLKKPNSWLVTANAVSLALVLYGCCFINVPRLVACLQCRALAGRTAERGPISICTISLRSVRRRCPSVEAALDARFRRCSPSPGDYPAQLRNRRLRPANWRGWSFRTWRLHRYLANNPDMAPKSLDGGKG